MQYSYLPSWVSLLVDSGRARQAGAALFDAVHARWERLPEDDRPLLVAFGESLGADGSEAAFSGIADVRNRTDGALWVGPPNFSAMWRSYRRTARLEHARHRAVTRRAHRKVGFAPAGARTHRVMRLRE